MSRKNYFYGERLQKSGTEEDTIVLRLIVELESRKEQRSE